MIKPNRIFVVDSTGNLIEPFARLEQQLIRYHHISVADYSRGCLGIIKMDHIIINDWEKVNCPLCLSYKPKVLSDKLSNYKDEAK
jgi:hypothetical protein